AKYFLTKLMCSLLLYFHHIENCRRLLHNQYPAAEYTSASPPRQAHFDKLSERDSKNLMKIWGKAT
ncbi:MAG: hypothetical protein K8R77_05305, partial [Anaerolineaceae bacterium]|nr:hypothetical protein [Anaerolineaceae bacterium]